MKGEPCNDCSQPIGLNKGMLCSKCSTRRRKVNNPFSYVYHTLKRNSHRRGIPFDLTLQQFKDFAIETDYILNKGTSKKGLTIDRINPAIGYRIDNIQAISNRANVIKQRVYFSYDERRLKVRRLTDWSNAPSYRLSILVSSIDYRQKQNSK
jgi:hypothetical protein